MELPGSSAGGEPSPTRREVQLQGPRPTPLSIRKESHKIKKPPVAPQPLNQRSNDSNLPPPPQQAAATTQNRQPVIIYAVSPKVIHTTATDFMSLVQRLTGSSSSSSIESSAAARGGDVSPAARLASTERASPKEREKERDIADLMGMFEGVEVGNFPGILSPAPATLPSISPGFFSPGFFSPVSDPHPISLLNDLSSLMYGNNMFIPSPSSTLFSAPIISPSPSSFDHFNPFLDF